MQPCLSENESVRPLPRSYRRRRSMLWLCLPQRPTLPLPAGRDRPLASRGQRPYRPGASGRPWLWLALVVPFLHQHCPLNVNSSVDWQPGGRLEMFSLSTSVPQNAGIMISVVFRGDNRRPLRILRSPTGCPRFPNLLGQIHGPTTAQHTFRRFLCGI